MSWGDSYRSSEYSNLGDYTIKLNEDSRNNGSWNDEAPDRMMQEDFSLNDEEDYDDFDGSDEDEDDETDDDSEQIGTRALAYDPIQLSNSIGLPVNGHDYLKMVQEERDRLPAVVSVPRPVSAKKSTQNSLIPMEVLQCDEEILDNQENCMPSQQSSLYPMDTSTLRESHVPSSASSSSSISSGDEENQLENELITSHIASGLYSGMAVKEIRKQLRLKSIGCTPLNLNRRPSATQSESIMSVLNTRGELIHRDQILGNFLKLRSQIESIRGLAVESANGDNVCDIGDEDTEPKQQKSNKRSDKNLSRCDRRVASLIRIINLGHPPLLKTIVHKGQRVIHTALERLAEQCEKAPIYSTLHADWIYSLIALLREPIEPDICSTLRQVAKLCIARRDNYERRVAVVSGGTMAPAADQPGPSLTASSSSRELVEAINDEEYYACLLIICIVRHHFGQADLK